MVNRLSILNDPPKVLEGSQLLHDLIDFDVHADACALDFSGNGKRFRYNYREIRSCAQSLAYRIREALCTFRATTDLVSQRQHLVPILLPQSPALYVAQLAILESGGAFCPINLDAPKERIKFVVGDVEADLIITTPEFKDVVSWENGPKVMLIDEFPTSSKEDGLRHLPAREPQPRDLAYVMYTSGSSGTPKGVAVSHFAASQSLLAHERHIPPFKRFLQFAAPSFDVSVFEIFFPLKRGSTLVGCNRSQLLDNLPGMINELQVDAAELTPTVVGSLLQRRANAPGLKLLLTIGEMLTRPIVEEFGGSEKKESMLYGMYGPTEAAIHCTVNPKMSADGGPSNIGVPFDTVSTFIAAPISSVGDGSIEVLSMGELGELVLGGPQLADGYLNRQEQNKAAFIHTGGQDYYRTGDKARLLENGTIEILGRISSGQVKLRGQRVELGEIEAAVYRHPGVRTASAAVISTVLVVFALVNNQSLVPEDILATCSKWLPKFMVPSEIILSQKFPYLPSGKVDKRKLESDYQSQRIETAGDDDFSATTAENVVRETIKGVLGTFSKNMLLAATGLDSLVAIRVATKLRQAGFNITTVAVLQAETPVVLARLCEGAASPDPQRSGSTPKHRSEPPPRIDGTSLKDIEFTMPCTPLQSAMLAETAVNEKAYRNWIELDLSSINDDDKLLLALQGLAQRNPILRTGFAESENAHGYVQLVWKAFDISRIETVKEFVYDFDPSKDSSLLRPIRIQIRHIESRIKLLIHIHHALYDAWSLELLMDDLDTLLMQKEPIQRPIFANLVDALLEGTIGSDSWVSRDYWQDYLAQLEFRRLPNFNTSKVSSQSLSMARLETSISTSEVEATARGLSSSPQSLFQAAYALILSSYLGSQDVCFGTVFSGRTLPLDGIEEIAGPCLSTLPVRIDVSTASTLQDLVQALNSTNRKHLEHSIVPLREIKSSCGVDPSNPLFDTLLIWQQTLHKYDQDRTHVSLVDSTDNLEFNLTLEVIPSVGNIVLKVNYREALLPKSQVDIFLRQIEQLAKVILEDCSILLKDAFGHLTSDLLSLENENPLPTMSVETLSSPVERIASEDPGRPAIDFAKSIDGVNVSLERISYMELNCRSNQIGQRLLQEGVLPDELVCICMEKSIDLYTTILATAKVGAGYLPVAPDTPSERLQHILQEAKVKLVIVQSCLNLHLNPGNGLRVICMDNQELSALSSENIPPRSSPESLAYSVFTSGSTGTPKGVLVTQWNILSNLNVLEELYPANNNSRLLQSCSQAFDVSVFEIFFAWRIGACLCSATKDVLFRDIEKAIRLLHVTHLSLTPTVASLVDPRNVPEVEFLVTAGEAVTQKVFNAWSGRGLYQGYGPSETTNICTVNPRVASDDLINNIGPPLRNTSAFVLSSGSNFELLPRGAEGEFCFGGSQIFRGYVNRSQEVGKIIEHPTFGRLYRSGDFGRLMPDGCLVFTGRKDDQVKVRGQRVELGEIDTILLRSPEVDDCITMVIDAGPDKHPQLISFWTATKQVSESCQVLRPDQLAISRLYQTLESSIPGYMLPSALIPLSSLPSTSQGKIDKRALIRLYKALDLHYLGSTARIWNSPSDHKWSNLELTIAETLSNITNVPLKEINADTSFFSLGIDSVSAISFSRTLRHITRVNIEISDILKYPSAFRLADKVSRVSQSENSLPNLAKNVDFGFQKELMDITIERFRRSGKDIQKILPCTPLQEAMLSAGESSSSAKLYTNEVTFDVRCDVERLQACWQKLVERHDILRTCFISTDMPRYPYVQIVLPSFDLKFQAVESLDNAKHTRTEFEPPYSFRLKKISGASKLVLSMHHALYDGVALSILYEEAERLYHGDSLPLSATFVPFLNMITSLNMESSDQFWEKVLKDFRPSKFPVITQEASINPNRIRIQSLHARSSLHWIEENVRRHNTTLLAVCHTIWASLISEHQKIHDVCFGNVVSGRTVPIHGIERLVAPCFNTIPSRLRDIHKTSYLEAFRRFQSLNADSLSFQFTPLRRIQSKFSTRGSRLFDTLFILQQPSQDLDQAIWSILEDNGAMDFPLVCEVVPKSSKDSLEIILHSHSSIITTDDAFYLLKAFDTKLRDALENPRRQLISSNFKEQMTFKHLEEACLAEEEIPGVTIPDMTPDELRLRDVLVDFTNVSIGKIGRDVSIFRLGLDSISAVQLAARLRKLGHCVKGSDILEHSTIAKLNAFLSSNLDTSDEESEYDFVAFDAKNRQAICLKNNIPSHQIEAIRPCTAIQQGMIAQSIHSQSQEYVNSMWLELVPNSSLSAFKEAWKVASKEHEMLRTGFSATDDPAHPFAMITYTKDDFELPWFEMADDSNSKYAIVHQLSRPPWRLVVDKEAHQTLVKFTAHHALYDAQSVQMILSDVANTYASRQVPSRQSISSLLGRILIDSENNSARQEFWDREENKIIVNRFPDLTPLRIMQTKDIVREVTSRASISELEECCKDNSVTVQAAGQVAWARLLSAYIGERSTTFGMTLSGRSVHEDADSISFPSIVTLPVRCDITGTNQELLSRTMNSNALLHKHQFTPLTSIQKWAGYPEGKIFDTLFAYQKVPVSESEHKLPWNMIREEASVDYVVSLEVQPRASGQITLRITFKDNKIPLEHADLLLGQYDILLLDTLRNPHNFCDVAPDVGTHFLSITPAKEAILSSPVTLLHEFVERGARKWPDRKALEFTSQLGLTITSRSWTYNELNNEANKIAQLLQAHKVPQGHIVAICFDKCAEASIGIIGILKAGCSYVALDPQAPADRLSFIIKDSGAEIILSAGETSKRIQSWVGNLVIALDSPHNFANCSSDPPSLYRCIEPTDISYCLYTSGTTGVPKGCLISHENAVQAMLSFQRLFYGHWDIESKWLQFASFHFDVSVLEQFWSWSVGICVASAPRDLIFEDIPRAIRQLGITHIDLTPSLARLLRPEDAPSLCKGVFITGGEQLKQEILDAWGDHSCIYNGYGPTEATIGVTMYPRVPKNGKPANIGPQFDNVGSFVLKPGTSLPVLRGGIGELCVSGKLVGKGYLNRPALTSERFPTLEAFGERLYRTGDLVRILVDGSFLFLGRADDQVKLRGQRLELSEINEVAKKSREDVQEVVTLVLKHNSQQNEQLVTFFVSEAEKSAELNSIISTMRYACQTRLPGYMVPTHFLPIRVLPLNANNKADTKQLAAIYNNFSVAQLQLLSRSGEQQEQWTNSEERIRGILAPLLHVHISALTRESTIFQLGLDSISVIGFSRNLQDAGFGNATLSLVKNNPAIGSLVQALLSSKSDKQQGGNDLIASIQNISAFSQKYMIGILNELGIDRSDIESLAPCTPVQEGMIYRFLERNQPLYFNHFEFILDEKVNIRKLLLAWQSLISHLQILRTKFVATDDGYAQVVLRKLDIDCEMPSPVYEATEKSIALKTPFHLHIINGAEKRMRMRIFHGLYDGNSLVILLHRLVDEYRGSQVVEYGPSFHSSLPNGPLAKVRGAQAFWRNHLLNWQDTKLPSKSPDIEKSIIATRIIPKLNGLEDFRKKIGVTHQAIIQAAWISVIHTISSPNLTIGMVVSGRAIEFEGADKVIGPLFNTVPFCTKIEPGMKLASLTSICHQFNMSMQDFQHTALKNIQKWVCVKPGQSLFDTLFVFQRAETNIDDFASDIWTRVDSEPISDYPLAFEATLSNDGSLAMTIAAQGSVIDTPEAETLLNHTETVILATLRAYGENTVPETTVNGQINLPSPVEGLESTTVPDNNFKATAFVWTEEAHIMRMEIASLANIEEIQVHENSSIFQLGLDSIDVIKLSSRLKKYGIIISVSTIINSQSIVKMASNISVNGPTDRKDDSSVRYVKTLSQDLSKYLVHRGLVLHEVETVLPATPLQQTMINEMLKSNFRRYFTLEVFSLDKNTDRSRLIAAVEAVVAESPILRTSFIEVDDPKLPVSYAQVILKSHKLVKESIEPNLEKFLSSFRAKSTASAVSDGTIFHVHVITVAEKSYLIWAISHALYDGASMELLHQDIDRAYRGKYSARPDCLPFLGCILKSTTDEVENFWKTNLSNLPEANFPRKDASQSSDPTTVHRLEMPSRVPLDNIEKICRSSKVTLQTLGQTCWAIVLGHLTGQLDVVFGSVLSCRDSEESNEIMFPLMNTVIVRSILHGTLAEMLNYVQDMGDTTRQYQHFPIGRAQALALSSRNGKLPEDTTLFDTLFIYQGRRRHAVDRSLYKSLYGASDVEFPVCVEMEIIDDRLVWNTACKSTARDAIETNNMMEMLDTILHRLIANPDAPTVVSDVEGISICGLPQFRMTEASLEKAPTSALTLDSRDWTPTELIIRKVLHDVSGVAEDLIHKDSTIFQLGLDSIIILKIPSLLRSHGISLSVADILRGQTIFTMSKSALHRYSNQTTVTDVEAVLSAAVTSLEPAIVQNLRMQFGEIENIMPATAGQLYMIRMWQSSRGILFYPSFTYSVRGVDKTRLQIAWISLLKHHEILRTGFVETGSNIWQITFRNSPSQTIHYQTASQDMSQESHHEIAGNDLSRPPVTLIVQESGDPYLKLKLIIHHALYDGISLPSLIQQLRLLCDGQSLPAALSFRNFVGQSVEAQQGTSGDSSDSNLTRKQWVSYLRGISYPVQSLVDPSTVDGEKRTEVFQPTKQVSSLREIAQEVGVSVDALLLASISKVYARYLVEAKAASAADVVFGIYLANRAPFGDDLSALVAPTLNILPLHVRDPISRRIEDLAVDIQEDLRKISSKQMSCASLNDIYKWSGVRVNFIVNILKDAGSEVEGSNEAIFNPIVEITRKAEVAEYSSNKNMPRTDEKFYAYLPSIDVEIRSLGNTVDIGVFAPSQMLSINQAESMIESFIELLT